jgi:hypothetical protein
MAPVDRESHGQPRTGPIPDSHTPSPHSDVAAPSGLALRRNHCRTTGWASKPNGMDAALARTMPEGHAHPRRLCLLLRKRIEVTGVPRSVVGIMPPGFSPAARIKCRMPAVGCRISPRRTKGPSQGPLRSTALLRSHPPSVTGLTCEPMRIGDRHRSHGGGVTEEHPTTNGKLRSYQMRTRRSGARYRLSPGAI